MEPHRSRGSPNRRGGSRTHARVDARVVLHRGRRLSLVEAALRLQQLRLEVGHFGVLQLDLVRRRKRRCRGRPLGGRRGGLLGDGRGEHGGRRRRHAEARRHSREHRRGGGRRGRRDRRLGRAPGLLDDDLLEHLNLLLVRGRELRGLEDIGAVLLRERLHLRLQPGHDAPENGELLVPAARLLHHRRPGAEARHRRVRVKLDVVELIGSVVDRLDRHDGGGLHEMPGGLLRGTREGVLDIDHRHLVHRPALELDHAPGAEHHVKVVAQGAQAALALDAGRDEDAHLRSEPRRDRAHPLTASPLRELLQIEELTDPFLIDADTEALVCAVHDPHVTPSEGDGCGRRQQRHQLLELGPRVGILRQDDSEGVGLVLHVHHAEACLRTKVSAQERKEARFDHDEDEAGWFARYVLSANSCDAVGSQPVRVLRAALLDELGAREPSCEHPHLELELMQVIMRPAGEFGPWRVAVLQDGHQDLGLMVMNPLDRVGQQVSTNAYLLVLFCIEVDGARSAVWLIVKRADALQSSDLMERRGPVFLLRLSEVKRHRGAAIGFPHRRGVICHAASLSCSYKSVLLLVPQPRPVAGLQAKGTAPVIRCLRWFSFFPS